MILDIKICKKQPQLPGIVVCLYVHAGCIQTSVLIMCDLKRTRPETPYEV